jgi:hypothetical protein
MRFKWSWHLQQRMDERDVTDEQVQQALDHGKATVGGPQSLCYRFTFEDGRTLKVWTVPGTKEPRVVKSTAWEDEEEKWL